MLNFAEYSFYLHDLLVRLWHVDCTLGHINNIKQLGKQTSKNDVILTLIVLLEDECHTAVSFVKRKYPSSSVK